MEEISNLRIAGVVRESIVDGPGIRFVVFSQGCPHNCPECHNAATHCFTGGYDCSIDKIINTVDEDPLIKGVTFSGGEPVCQAEAFVELGKKVKERNLDIVMFTGYTFEELNNIGKSDLAVKKLLSLVDIMIDGKYEKDKRDLTLQYRGSSNQRVIDMKKTRDQGEIILWNN